MERRKKAIAKAMDAAIRRNAMKTRNLAGILIVVLLTAMLAGAVFWISKPKADAQAEVTGAMSYDGFSSYEEMMKAHHGADSAGSANDPAQGEGGCGGVGQADGQGQKVSYLGEMADYGVTYDDKGYNKLLEAAKAVELSSAQTNTIVGLDVQMPCCGFATLQAQGNCECGHHIALYGLAKLMASKGYDSKQIQVEIDKWKAVFYPEGGAGNTGGC